MKTHRKHAGESITETMVAMLIVAFSVLFLANAVVSAARVNSRIKNGDEEFSFLGDSSVRSAEVTILLPQGDDPSISVTKPVQLYQSEKDYVYYDYHATPSPAP